MTHNLINLFKEKCKRDRTAITCLERESLENTKPPLLKPQPQVAAIGERRILLAMSNPLGCSSLACLLLMSFLVLSMAMTNTLESKNWLSDYLSDTLISPTQKFQLGFFTPNKSSNGSRVARYVGIWYYNNPDIIVWVANRDNPILDSPGLIQITADGKFIITDEKNVTKWSSGSITNSGGSSSAIFYLSLQDSGNLVLSRQHENAATATLWQSFDHPTDTFIPGMRMDQNNKINLTSWRSEVDPSSGDFSFQQDPAQVEQYCILSRDNYRWKSGSSGRFRSGKFISDEIPNLMSDLLSNTTTPKRSIPDANPKLLPHPNIHVNETRLRMKFDGTLELLGITNQSWLPYWSQPTDNCGVFEACGKFSVCSTTHKDGLNYTCKCLPGCQPTSPDNWASGQFSQGCGRVASTCSENFTSLTITRIQRPVQPLQPNERIDANECRSKCISSCCNGYAYTQTENLLRDRSSNRTCWLWKDELSNVISETDAEVDDQQVFYFRVSEPNLEIQNSNEPQRTWEKKKPPLSLTLPGSVAVALVTACTIFILYHQLKRRRGIQQGNRQSTQGNLSLQLYDSESRLKAFMGSSEVGDDDNKGIEVPSFDLDAIKFATKNFSDENKLGQGGFGPVYKGSFTAGQEIAIKRLSSTSGQGLEEFKNEILLIAKLQHRNLVRLLGYCAEGYEKLLIYEYMPNKSLDSFIFDRTRCVLLNWEKRFNIILGIARGMLYLHQDSRLRIIHRDLKTSNVLLDKDMNPKISDFGLARIFGGTQTEAATNRVVGTYGYMSPEYAVDGFFSVKSDVFSFGVVILEILSGKRNTGFYRSKQPFSLLSHAWRLWKEGKPLELMDQTLMETVNGPEFKRCLTIGLLCVEEDPGDRPTMSSAVYMLGNESEAVTMPEPKQPAFVLVERSTNSTSSVSTSAKMEPSNVELTITVQDGR